MVGCLTFYRLHDSARGNFWWHIKQQVHMIWPYVSLHDDNPQRITYLAHKITQPQRNITNQDRPAVFGYENEVIMQQEHCMGCFSITLHFNIIPQAS